MCELWHLTVSAGSVIPSGMVMRISMTSCPTGELKAHTAIVFAVPHFIGNCPCCAVHKMATSIELFFLGEMEGNVEIGSGVLSILSRSALTVDSPSRIAN